MSPKVHSIKKKKKKRKPARLKTQKGGLGKSQGQGKKKKKGKSHEVGNLKMQPKREEFYKMKVQKYDLR